MIKINGKTILGNLKKLLPEFTKNDQNQNVSTSKQHNIRNGSDCLHKSRKKTQNCSTLPQKLNCIHLAAAAASSSNKKGNRPGARLRQLGWTGLLNLDEDSHWMHLMVWRVHFSELYQCYTCQQRQLPDFIKNSHCTLKCIKVKCAIPCEECKWDAHLPSLRLEPVGG